MKSLCILAALLMASIAYAGQTQGIKEAENVAVRYMRAYFSVEMEKVADLTHPDTINAFYNTFNQELKKAIESGSEKEFLTQGGLKLNSSKLKSMSPRDLFTYVVESNNLRAPAKYHELMKQTTIAVLKSEQIDRDSAKVFLRFTNPSGSRSEYTGGLLLRIHNGEWKVLSNTADPNK
jgi:hypothetical protein